MNQASEERREIIGSHFYEHESILSETKNKLNQQINNIALEVSETITKDGTIFSAVMVVALLIHNI